MFFFDAEHADVAVVELHGAGDVAVDAAGGEDAGLCVGDGVVHLVEGLYDGRGLVDVVWGGGGGDVLAGCEAYGAEGYGAFGLELAEEAAYLVFLYAGGVFVVEEGDVFCALEEAVEVVGVDGYAMACGGEVEACA